MTPTSTVPRDLFAICSDEYLWWLPAGDKASPLRPPDTHLCLPHSPFSAAVPSRFGVKLSLGTVTNHWYFPIQMFYYDCISFFKHTLFFPQSKNCPFYSFNYQTSVTYKYSLRSRKCCIYYKIQSHQTSFFLCFIPQPTLLHHLAALPGLLQLCGRLHFCPHVSSTLHIMNFN